MSEMNKLELSPGDWIIASKPRVKCSISLWAIFPTVQQDFAFMNKPIRVHTVTPTHIIFDRGDDTDKRILSQYELKERGFVVADEAIVSLLTK